jgi:tetratricopeptide (TPR) repeat protein
VAAAAELKERAERLAALFARLTSTNDAVEGDTIVEEIWRVWLDSGRPEIDAILQEALALVETGQPQAAMPLLDSIVERAPEWAEGWNKRATVLYLLDEYDRSLADIDKVLVLEPRHFGALAGRGLIHIAQENYRAALDDYRRARAANPFLQGAAQMIPTLERRVGERPL